MPDIRKQPSRLPPALIPEALHQAAYPCPSCGIHVEVPWTEKMDFPQQPIAPAYGGGHWVPISIPLQCSSTECSTDHFHLPVPVIENESTWNLFGDEAGRLVELPYSTNAKEALHFFCITLVGIHRRKKSSLQRRMAALKKKVRPDQDPDDWQHHYSEIWSSDARDSHFKLSDKKAKIDHALQLSKIIREARPELFTLNVSSCIKLFGDKKDRAKQIASQKQEIFSICLLSSLEQMRSRKLGVSWTFDNIQDSTSGARTEGWAQEVFRGLQYTRLFTWLCAGVTIAEPVFVKPGSNFLLEIADFISYSIARDFYNAVREEPIEFPSSLLGPGLYQALLIDGSIDFRWEHGLPLEAFWGLKRRQSKGLRPTN